MINMSLQEAQLMRILSAYFGSDRVIPQMSVMAVCGGQIPEFIHTKNSLIKNSFNTQNHLCSDLEIEQWARANKCLFTILDHNDNPIVVFDFSSDFSKDVDLKHLENEKYLKPLLNALGIKFISFTQAEFNSALSSEEDFDFVGLVESKVPQS